MEIKSQRSDGTEEYDPEKAESNSKNNSGEISFVEEDPDLMDESVPMSEILKNKKEITQPIKTQQSAHKPNNALSCTSGLLMCG